MGCIFDFIFEVFFEFIFDISPHNHDTYVLYTSGSGTRATACHHGKQQQNPCELRPQVIVVRRESRGAM
jgi:hypothetical protein